MAVADAGAEVLIMDDGFQHRALRRDLDIVVVDDSAGTGTAHVFPAGMMREPLRGLRRADMVIHSRGTDARGSIEGNEPESEDIRMQFRQRVVRRWIADGTGEPVDLRGKRVLAFCGIGNPAAFRKTVESLGAIVADLIVFRDHHPYAARDISRLIGEFGRSGAEWMITTEKDTIRLRACTEATELTRHAISFVEIEAVFTDGEDALLRAVNRVTGMS
jgi:tetraacyldisaccharide 4'-kinase